MSGLKRKAWSNAAPGEEGTWEPPPEENQPAYLRAVIDLGTHVSEWEGEERDREEVYLVWELTAAPKSGMTGVNHTIGQIFTNSFHRQSGLRKMISALIKRDIADGEDMEEHLRALFELPCLVDVKHKDIVTRKGDPRTVANWKGCSQPPRGMVIPPPKIATPVFWELNPTQPLPDQPWLPLIYGKTVADKIRESAEWKAAGSPQPPRAQPQTSAARTTSAPAPAAQAPPPARRPEPPAGTRQKVPAFNPATVQQFWVETVEDGVQQMNREALKTLVDTFKKESEADANIGVMDQDKQCGEWKVPSFFGVVPNPF